MSFNEPWNATDRGPTNAQATGETPQVGTLLPRSTSAFGQGLRRPRTRRLAGDLLCRCGCRFLLRNPSLGRHFLGLAHVDRACPGWPTATAAHQQPGNRDRSRCHTELVHVHISVKLFTLQVPRCCSGHRSLGLEDVSSRSPGHVLRMVLLKINGLGPKSTRHFGNCKKSSPADSQTRKSHNHTQVHCLLSLDPGS